MNTLFEVAGNLKRPLAFRMRPDSLEKFVGQSHILGENKNLRKLIDSGDIFSIVLYGPPGTGKTALANIIAQRQESFIERINAVNSNVKEIRAILERAKAKREMGQKTLLIIDEIHRFSVNQQESLLPDVEEGNITLVGLTTENPFYFISGPLLSRTSVFQFKTHNKEDIKVILKRAASDKENGLGKYPMEIEEEAIDYISELSSGDARYALNLIENSFHTASLDKIDKISADFIKESSGQKKFLYDRSGDKHYDTISAFIKSIRGSDPDAALYYLAKMLLSGEDPRFIARRLVIAASEDVGNADPKALLLADACINAVEYVGMPEARIILSQVTVYLASSPKSNSAYKAINDAMKYVQEEEETEIPVHLTKKGSTDYKYPHNYEGAYVKQTYMAKPIRFYTPLDRGNEKLLKKYLENLGDKK